MKLKLNETIKRKIFLVVNLYLLISTIIVTYCTLAFGTVAGQVDTGGNYGVFYLVTFTVESNILLGFVAGAAAIRGIVQLAAPKTLKIKLSGKRFFTVLYLVAATSAMLTCLTVVLFLAPARAFSGRNYFDMLMGPMFFFHFFNPVVAATALILISGDYIFTRRDRLFVLIPPALYAVPYITNVVFTGLWPDFYGFTFGGRNFLVIPALIVFLVIVYLIGFSLARLHNLAKTT